MKECLTKGQFFAARALADEFRHLWAGCGDECRSLTEIDLYSDSVTFPGMFGGIPYPDVDKDGCVVHRTGGGIGVGKTGRLCWRVSPEGTVELVVHRPAGIILRVMIINWLGGGSYWPREGEGLKVLISGEKGEELREQFAERHARILVRALGALHGACERPYARHCLEGEGFEDWKERVVAPGKVWARQMLGGIVEDALPDPVEEWQEKPSTYWTRDVRSDVVGGGYGGEDYVLYQVWHQGEVVAVESERVAVRAVVEIRESECSLLEALHRAGCDRRWRG